MPCDINKCKAVCCTFTTIYYPIRTDSIRQYFTLHNIECINDPDTGGLYLKLPLPCTALNQKTRKCTIYKNRPNACKIYPEKPSMFIPKELCSMNKP